MKLTLSAVSGMGLQSGVLRRSQSAGSGIAAQGSLLAEARLHWISLLACANAWTTVPYERGWAKSSRGVSEPTGCIGFGVACWNKAPHIRCAIVCFERGSLQDVIKQWEPHTRKR